MTDQIQGTPGVLHPSELNLYFRNPRVGNVDVIKSSLRAHSQYKPILVNKGTYTGRPNEVLAGNHCVDIETEALTKRGWVSGPDLTEDDTILSCDKDGQLRWSRIKSIFRNWDYSGLMYRLENQAIDAFVSPGHKFLLSDGRLRPVEDLKTSDVIITMGEALEGSEATYSDAFVELVGWAVTEGSFRIGTERTHPYEKPATKWVRISQLPGDYADRIEDCLEAVGAEYRVGRSGRQGRVLSFDVAKDIANELHDIAPNRVMTREFMHALTSDQRRLLIETMVDGDGWRHGNTLHYCQKDPEHMAALAYLAALSGLTTYERLRTPPETDGDYRNAQPCLVMTIHGDGQMSRKRAHFKKHWRTEDQYTGLIWCPETEYGTFVCRRGGKVYVTGNTTKAIRDLAEEYPEDERWQEVQVWEIDVDDDRAARIVIADNRTAELGHTDSEALTELLSELDGLDGTGYTDADLEDLLDETRDPNEFTGKDDAPSRPKSDPITKEGDVWQLGPHRVYCGDSTDPDAVVENLMHDGLADCVWTDPPYGVNYVGGTGMTIQNDGPEGLEALLNGAMITAVAASKGGAPVYVAHSETKRMTFEGAMLNAGMLVRQNLVWVKSSLVLGRLDYQSRHEPILYGSTPEDEAPEESEEDQVGYYEGHNPVLYGFTPGGKGKLGRGGERWYGDHKRTSVFEYPKPSRSADHPTMKPVELVQAMLDNSCPRKGIVLDLFGGSGSTLIAAHHHGSYARLVELDPKYVDVICRRYEEHAGVKPVRVSDGKEVSFIR